MRAGIPHLLANGAPPSNAYASDELIQAYYEMQFGSCLVADDLEARHASARHGVEDFGELGRRRSRSSRSAADFYRSVGHLIGHPQLTEEFYACVVDLTEPYVDKGSAVLDVGCGLGRATVEVAALGAGFVLGMDLSPAMIAEAVRLLSGPGEVPIRLNLVAGRTMPARVRSHWDGSNYDFLVGDCQAAPVRGESFDLVLCLNVIDMVAAPRLVVSEARRALKAGGRLVIADPYGWRPATTPRAEWFDDMAVLFSPESWEKEREIDGIPFVVRSPTSRMVTIFMDHCLVYRKLPAG